VKVRYELSPEQMALFDDRVLYWQERLGLNDWRVKRSKRRTAAMSDMKIYHPDRLASYSIGDFGPHEITDQLIDSTACHEMLHLLLAELKHMTVESEDHDLRMAAEHRVVITLEKLLTGLGNT
jgi:hypothetical protein